MTQLNASVLQLRLGLGLGLKFGYSSIDWDILYLLNTFLRYRQFKSVSDGHSPKLLYKSIVQPSLRLQRYLEFISVSRFLIPYLLFYCHRCCDDVIIDDAEAEMHPAVPSSPNTKMQCVDVVLCFHLVEMHWESDTKWGAVGEISRQAGIFSVKYRAIFRPDFNQYSAHILPTKCNRDRKAPHVHINFTFLWMSQIFRTSLLRGEDASSPNI